MLVVGLTGGIASGKTTVGRLFEEVGIPIICADDLAKKAVSRGSPALDLIRQEFGETVIDSSGELDRVEMARVVFSDSAKRKTLEAIIHPVVSSGKELRLRELQQSGCKIAIVDVPLLYETGWDKSFDVIIVVFVPRNIQESRLANRDHFAQDEVKSRLDSQMSLDEKRKRAHFVIDNSGDIDDTRDQVSRIVGELKKMEKEKGHPEQSCAAGKI
jgi:dephospho-CoA kinase